MILNTIMMATIAITKAFFDNKYLDLVCLGVMLSGLIINLFEIMH